MRDELLYCYEDIHDDVNVFHHHNTVCTMCTYLTHYYHASKKGRTHFVYHVATLLIITHTTIGFYLKMDPNPNPTSI